MTLDSTGALSLGRLNGTGGSRGFALGMRRVNGSNPFAGSTTPIFQWFPGHSILREVSLGHPWGTPATVSGFADFLRPVIAILRHGHVT